MHAMPARRLVAIVTAITVAWTALWPLVSSARLLAADEEMMLCHQAGTQVDPAEAPRPPGLPAEGKQHCPLCVMAFLAAFAEAPLAPAMARLARDATLDVYCAPLPAGIQVHLPPSRAPPAA
jgi:hypothetical protein